MYDINTKNIRKGRKFFAIFTIAGGLFLVIMLIIFIVGLTTKDSLKSETMSTSVNVNGHYDSDGDYMYTPSYTYEVDGKSYVCSSSVSSSINPGEENKKIYYDPANPEKCMSEYTSSTNWIILPFMAIPGLFIVIGVIMDRKIMKRVKKVEALNQTGKLVKNIPYRLEEANIEINNRPLMKIVVDYRLPNGQTVTLQGDPRYDRKESDEDGKVDLVIDESDPSNYFIDFEINRLSGNRSDDYYKDENAPAPEESGTQHTTYTQDPMLANGSSEPYYDASPESEPNTPPAIKI